MSIREKAKIIMPIAAERDSAQRAHDLVAERQYASKLRFNGPNRAFHLVLRSGATVSIPVNAIPELAAATQAQLNRVRLISTGGALEQRELDVDLSLPGLLRDVLGFGDVQQSRAARVRSEAKTAAARLNGKKGGRPRKKTG